MKGNKTKAKALGMPYGTAAGRLRKMVLFSLLRRVGENVCYRCQQPIEVIEELSLDHKKPWLNSVDPVDDFFDLWNVAFSHLSCNVAHANKPTKQWETEEERKTHEAKIERDRWARLSKEEQQRIRREKYERNGQ